MSVKMTNHDPHLQKTVSVNMRCLGPLRRRNCKNRYLLSKIDKEYLKKVECGTGLVMWILIYILTAMMPNSVNPRLNQWFYLILGVAAFALDIWLRGRYHITSAFSPRRQQRQ